MEAAYNFGFDGALAGILCRPEHDDPARPTVVIPNAYVTPHVGLFRMHVEIARALAAAGFRSFRFDISGIGDSTDRADAALYTERAAEDLSEAVRFVGDITPTEDVVLLGHCDGGNHAFHAAVREPTACGVVCIDSFMQPSARYWVGAAGRRIRGYFDPVVLRERLARRRGRSSRSSMLSLRALAGEEGTLYMGSSPPEAVSEGSRTLVARGAASFWVFSGEYLRIARYREVRAHLEAADDGGRIEHVVLEGARHIYPETGHRRRLVEEITAWMQRTFAAQRSAARRNS